MTVQELIDRLEQIENKTKKVIDAEYGGSINMVESDDCVYL